jgi:hypothetical protein
LLFQNCVFFFSLSTFRLGNRIQKSIVDRTRIYYAGSSDIDETCRDLEPTDTEKGTTKHGGASGGLKREHSKKGPTETRIHEKKDMRPPSLSSSFLPLAEPRERLQTMSDKRLIMQIKDRRIKTVHQLETGRQTTKRNHTKLNWCCARGQKRWEPMDKKGRQERLRFPCSDHCGIGREELTGLCTVESIQ